LRKLQVSRARRLFAELLVQETAATLDDAPTAVAAGTPLPPLWHWLYFLPLHRQSDIGPDGHAKRGGFLPPVPLPRRMWAGSQFAFRHPLRIGDAITRRSTIADVSSGAGSSPETTQRMSRGSRTAMRSRW